MQITTAENGVHIESGLADRVPLLHALNECKFENPEQKPVADDLIISLENPKVLVPDANEPRIQKFEFEASTEAARLLLGALDVAANSGGSSSFQGSEGEQNYLSERLLKLSADMAKVLNGDSAQQRVTANWE